MAMEYIFTDHAIERIRGRKEEEGVVPLTMSLDEVTSFLKNGVFVETSIRPLPGYKWNPKIVYLAFYSPSDDNYFVAVGDRSIQKNVCTIITIIPADRKSKWSLSWSLLDKAKTIACNHINFVPLKFLQTKDVGVAAKNIHVLCIHLQEDCRSKIRKLFHIPSFEHSGIDSLIAEEKFIEKCKETAKDHGIPPNNIIQILVRYGTSGVPVVIDI